MEGAGGQRKGTGARKNGKRKGEGREKKESRVFRTKIGRGVVE